MYFDIQSMSEIRTIDRSVIRCSDFGRSNDSNVRIGILMQTPKSEGSNMHGQPTERLKSDRFVQISDTFVCSNKFTTEQRGCV